VAKELGDISVHHVWRVLREKGISLERRHSWCISTDPEFTAKAADIVGLYLSPPEGALIISVDEKPCIQALERAQGYLKLHNGKTLTGILSRIQTVWNNNPLCRSGCRKGKHKSKAHKTTQKKGVS
jgi:hypothetical protein